MFCLVCKEFYCVDEVECVLFGVDFVVLLILYCVCGCGECY